MKSFFLPHIIFLIFVTLHASSANRICKTGVYNSLLQDNRLNAISIQNVLNQKHFSDSICIPVVIHNVYHLPEQKIDYKTVKAQIESLNQDFNATNVDVEKVAPNFKSLIANVAFRFFLVNRDLEGNVFDGINYKRSEIDTFNMNQYPNVKLPLSGIKPWKPREYVNIWVCNLEAGISGYASYPGTMPNEDGIVIHYQNFGKESRTVKPPFHLGRTLTHEFGHFFGLKHLYGNELNSCADDDGLADTPKTNKAYRGCPQLGENRNVCNDPYSKQDMVQNFMNHANDDCIHMFTQNQKALMQYHLMQHRNMLIHQNCWIESNYTAVDASIRIHTKPIVICNLSPTLQLDICNHGLTDIHSFKIENTISNSVLENMHITPNECITYELVLSNIANQQDITVQLTQVNGLANEFNIKNNSDTATFKFLSQANFPFKENFMTDPQWITHTTNEEDTSDKIWVLENPADLNSGCYTINKLGVKSTQQVHLLHLPYFNLAEISANSKNENLNLCLDFDYAYFASNIQEFSQVDGMIVEYASVCSPDSYLTIWEKWGKDLETTLYDSNTTNFPASNNWQTVHQNLPIQADQHDELLFRIQFILNSSNTFFIDNFSFKFCESIPLNIQNYLTEHYAGVFPNPSFDGQFHLYSANPKNLPINVEVFDAFGQTIDQFQFQKHYPLHLNHFPNGCYFIKMQFEGQILSKKLILSK